MIFINNLNKYYNKGKNNEIHAINNTSIVFPDKGLVCLTGPSGCGKTTLLNCIGGMDNPSSGFISYDGVDLTKKELDLYRAQNIGFVFQNYILLPDRTVYENLKIVLNMFNLSKEEEEERIEFALNAVNMFKYRKRICGQLSGGQMQRVAIARALVNNPEILLADEPTGALDTKTSIQVLDLLKEIAKERLVIMVTHNPDLAKTYSTRIISLLDGNVISDSNPYEGAKESKQEKVEKKKKTSMSFLTALSLSLKNLLTKKGRTFLVAFAGSIGIIGIATMTMGWKVKWLRWSSL